MCHNLCSPKESHCQVYKKTIVLKGKRNKAQWWISNYTVDPHWSLTTHGIALRLCILGMLDKIYHHAKFFVSSTPLKGLRPIWTTQSMIMCPQGVFFYQSFRERLGKAISRAFKICYLTYLFSFWNDFKLPSKALKIFLKLKIWKPSSEAVLSKFSKWTSTTKIKIQQNWEVATIKLLRTMICCKKKTLIS